MASGKTFAQGGARDLTPAFMIGIAPRIGLRSAGGWAAALLLTLPATAAAVEPGQVPDGDGGLRLYRQAPDFTLAPEVNGLVARPVADGVALARRVTAAGRPAATTVAAAPRPLPAVPDGIPVVVRRSTPFHAAAFAADAPAAPEPSPRPRRLPSPAAPRRLDAASSDTVSSVATAVSPDAEAEIRGMLREYHAAFNRHDAGALAACWSGACESVDLASGDVTQGRQAVEQVFAALFRADDHATIDLDVESIRMVRHDVGVVDAVSRIAFSDTGTAARSRLTAVVTREDGGWMLSSVRESPLQPESAAPTDRPLDGLDWLVGDWEDAGDGVSARTRCFWSTGRAFLIRCHTAAFDGSDRPPAPAEGIPGLLPPGSGSPREITEVIGWDPASASIRSWVFTSEGRFAEGTWSRHGERWLVRMEGRGADAGAACTATIERIGVEKLAFRCTGDALADALPPACDFDRTAAAESGTLVR